LSITTIVITLVLVNVGRLACTVLYLVMGESVTAAPAIRNDFPMQYYVSRSQVL